MKSTSIVETYWSGVSRRLQEEVDIFNKLIGHAGEQGRENEQSLIRLMERLLPRSLGIGSGVVIDADGRRSKQCDIIIFDSANQPSVMAQTSQMLYPVENTFMVIEVKTTLEGEEAADCGEKKAALEELQPRGGHATPFFCVLSYHAQAGTAPTVAKELRDVPAEKRPNLTCIISSAILAGEGRLISDDGDDAYQVGVSPLHERDSDGRRIPATWAAPRSDEAGSFVLRDGVRYPIIRKGRRKEQRLVAEPGRALLNFCSIILSMLADRGAIPQPFLRYYLQDSAKELELL